MLHTGAGKSKQMSAKKNPPICDDELTSVGQPAEVADNGGSHTQGNELDPLGRPAKTMPEASSVWVSKVKAVQDNPKLREMEAEIRRLEQRRAVRLRQSPVRQ